MAAPDITPLPTAPLPNDSKAVFNAKAFPFVNALGQFQGEINALVTWLNDNINVRQPAVVTTSSFNLPGTDSGAYVRAQYIGAKNITLQSEADEPQQDGATFLIANRASGDLTLIVDPGVTINSNAVLENGAAAVLQRVSVDTWDLIPLGGEFTADLAALEAEIDLKAPLSSPVFTGNPTAPTPPANDNDTSIATTAYVQTELLDRPQTIENVAALSAFTPVVGQIYKLKEYHANTGSGGGDFVAKAGAITANNVTTFSCAGLTYVERINCKTPNVHHAGAIGDGLTDDTAAMQRAINYCLSKITMANMYGGRGAAKLRVPAGCYKVTDALDIVNVEGFVIEGDGASTTAIVATAHTSLIDLTTYVGVHIKNISLLSGAISAVGGLPYVTPLPRGTRTCIGLYISSTGAGTGLHLDGCRLSGFSKVFDTTQSIVNGDDTVVTECTIENNDVVWNNTNTQAVIWTFRDCRVHFNEVIFKNAAGQLLVSGGDFINGGDFYVSDGVTSLGLNATFENVKFETFVNIDPLQIPRWLVLNGASNNIKFIDCSSGGGTVPLTGKTTALLNGLFDVRFIGSYFDGIFVTNNSVALGGMLASLYFERCESVPVITQTLSGGTGNRPINLEYVNCNVDGYGRITRRFTGATANTLLSRDGLESVDKYYIQDVLVAASITHEIPVFCPSSYSLILSGVSGVAWSTSTVSFTIRLFSDAGLTKMIYEFVKPEDASANIRYPLPFATLPSDAVLGGVVYLQVSTAGAAGAITSHLGLHYSQAV